MPSATHCLNFRSSLLHPFLNVLSPVLHLSITRSLLFPHLSAWIFLHISHSFSFNPNFPELWVNIVWLWVNFPRMSIRKRQMKIPVTITEAARTTASVHVCVWGRKRQWWRREKWRGHHCVTVTKALACACRYARSCAACVALCFLTSQDNMPDSTLVKDHVLEDLRLRRVENV